MTAESRLDFSLWRHVIRLLKVSWLMSYKGFARSRWRVKIRYIILGVLAAGFVAILFAASWGLLSLFRSPEAASAGMAPLLASLPTIVLTSAFFLTLTFSFGVLLQGLYLAGDMEFLLTAPIPIRAVFVSKLLQAILPNFALTSAFSLPILWGLGSASGYSWPYFPLALATLAAVVLAAAGLAGVLVMAVARLFPARAVAEVLGLIGGVLALVLSQAGQFANSFHVGRNQVQQGLQFLTWMDAPWSPFDWAGRGIAAVGSGAWLSGAGLVALSLVLCAAAFSVALVVSERLYFSGWARIVVGPGKRRAVKAAGRPRTSRVRFRFLPLAVQGTMLKDSIVLRRDLRSLSQLVGPLILGIIYAILFLRGGGEAPVGRGEAPVIFMRTLQGIFAYGNTVIALFIGWSFISRLSLMGFSQEGKYYWILKTSPITPTGLLVAKFLVAYLPTLALDWVFVLIVSFLQGVGFVFAAFGMTVVALCLAGGTALFLAFGVSGARLDWTDPRRMISTSASCFGSIATGIYMIVDLALFLGPPIVLTLMGYSEPVGQALGLVLGGVLSLFCTALPLWEARSHVPRIGEA